MVLRDIAVQEGWVSAADVALYSNTSDSVFYDRLIDRFHVSEQHLMRVLEPTLRTIFCRELDQLIPGTHAKTVSSRCFRLYEAEDAVGFVVSNPYTEIPASTPLKSVQLYWVSRETFLSFTQESPLSLRSQPSDTPLKAHHPSLESLTHLFGDMVGSILSRGLEKQASDIHFFSTTDGCRCDFRVHGEVYTYQTYSQSDWKKLLNLLKFHGQMDLSIHLNPQDGRLMGPGLSCRMATLPSLFGEDIVIRFTQQTATLKHLSDLGMCPVVYDSLCDMIQHPSGLLLITGPTGSGKTTTLYGVIDHILHQSKRVIVTLEDPIERPLEHVRQSQINRLAGYGFSEGLRAILRQDPDVILIGEIRDHETARIALEAAYTGHLVLSSLHTSTVSDSLLRLLSFGVDPFLIGHSLRGVICQRLDPIYCHDCTGKGCASCDHAGMIGRQAYHACFQPNGLDIELASHAVTDYIQRGQYWSYEQDEEVKDGTSGGFKRIKQ